MVVTLDDANHRYHDETGREVPGVGQIIREHGFQMPMNEAAMDFGRIVHKATEFYDRGLFDAWPGGGEVDEYLAGYRLFLEQARPTILEIERVVYHSLLDYAGIPDRVVTFPGRAARYVLDLKTGSKTEMYWIKAAAYAMALEHESILDASHPPYRLALLYLRPRNYSLDICQPFEEAAYRERWLRMAA